MTGPPFEPRKFGRYHLVDLLAVGGMAEIFKAKTIGVHGFEKTLVIKRILPHLALDHEFIDMFIDEAKLMAQLSHPKIVQVLDFGEIEGQYYMALEYIDGVDGLALLRRCAKRRCRPTTGIALHVAADVLDALDFAHSLCGEDGGKLGVVHRDISPSNIFISWVGEVKLGDFGIARAALRRGSTETGALKGKYGYMAPEQATGGIVDHRADVFSVGVVLAELLMIRRLFYAKNDLEVLLQVRDARLDRLDRYGSRIPIDLRAILESALARDPNMRYQSAGTFRDALHRYLFDHRRMVRNTDVRNFLQRLTEADGPLEPVPRVPSREVQRSSDSAPLIGTDECTPAVQAVADRAAALAAAGAPGPWPQGSVGRKRKIIITPPPMPRPVPTGLPHTGEEPRLDTADALAAVPEMGPSDSSSHFDPTSIGEDAIAAALAGAGSAPETPSMNWVGDRARHGTPASSGEISGMSLFRLFFRLAVDEETGLLVVESAVASKEVYLLHGDPQFVTSNRAQELFGQYLVAKGALAEGELSMALAMLPMFDGRLGDALVGLKLMRPVQVLRHLTSQVRHKLLDVFSWDSGEYRFYPGATCMQESAPLGLDAFEIIGAAVRSVSTERLERVLRQLLSRRLRAATPAPVPPEVFRLGGLPRRVFDKLDGRHTVADLVSAYDDPEQRLEFLRMIVLLATTGMVL